MAKINLVSKLACRGRRSQQNNIVVIMNSISLVRGGGFVLLIFKLHILRKTLRWQSNIYFIRLIILTWTIFLKHAHITLLKCNVNIIKIMNPYNIWNYI